MFPQNVCYFNEGETVMMSSIHGFITLSRHGFIKRSFIYDRMTILNCGCLLFPFPHIGARGIR
jgi:hypothetical protein